MPDFMGMLVLGPFLLAGLALCLVASAKRNKINGDFSQAEDYLKASLRIKKKEV